MGGDAADCGDVTEGWLSSLVVIVGIFGCELRPEPSEGEMVSGIARPLAPLLVVDMACDVITCVEDLVEEAPGGD